MSTPQCLYKESAADAHRLCIAYAVSMPAMREKGFLHEKLCRAGKYIS